MLTVERLREVLHYDPETGVFTSIIARGKLRKGAVLGTRTSKGYFEFTVEGAKRYAHCWAWFYVTGEWPSRQIDHRDTDKSNNKWGNFRLATNAQNHQNRTAPYKGNLSGLLGVHPRRNKYTARISVGGKQKYLGTFSDKHEAHTAYLKAKAELHPFSAA